jgi:hypothetical protein
LPSYNGSATNVSKMPPSPQVRGYYWSLYAALDQELRELGVELAWHPDSSGPQARSGGGAHIEHTRPPNPPVHSPEGSLKLPSAQMAGT